MHSQTGKAKTAMLLELESIKGLLVEEDNIPILQEVVAQDIPLLDLVASPDELSVAAIPVLNMVVAEEELRAGASAVTSGVETATPLKLTQSLTEMEAGLASALANALAAARKTSHRLDEQILHSEQKATAIAAEPALAMAEASNDLGNSEPSTGRIYRREIQQDFFLLVEDEPPVAAPTAPSAPASPAATRATQSKSAGDNPFLPEHIRARLQRSNAAHARQTDDVFSTRFKNLPLGNLHSPAPGAGKTSALQQQLINDVMDKILPEMARELRGRLEQMSKRMLEELLAEHK